MILETKLSVKYFFVCCDILNLNLFPQLVCCVAKNPCASVGGCTREHQQPFQKENCIYTIVADILVLLTYSYECVEGGLCFLEGKAFTFPQVFVIGIPGM